MKPQIPGLSPSGAEPLKLLFRDAFKMKKRASNAAA